MVDLVKEGVVDAVVGALVHHVVVAAVGVGLFGQMGAQLSVEAAQGLAETPAEESVVVHVHLVEKVLRLNLTIPPVSCAPFSCEFPS